jgi:UDP-N-acetyl-D-galactosamine dehydrogenase
MKIYERLISGEAKVSVIGLGYVGLPIALEFAKHVGVIGFDINEERIGMMQNQQDPSDELEAKDFENADIEFSCNPEKLKEASFHIVAVPTPIDDHKMPDLKPLRGASQVVGDALKKGDYVVFESTVYPGATEEVCLPILEKLSGLKLGEDFKLGYSPERINPGDKEHTLTNITKIVSGSDDDALKEISKVYQIVVEAGVHEASNIKVAEAAKIIENTQRDLNIALMNELSMIFEKVGINTFEVLEAAGTKWNFLKFSPGLVGGHCIGVDPYYLTYKASQLGYTAHVINSGRAVNDTLGKNLAHRLIRSIIFSGKSVKNSRVLVMGTTFKENVSDIRNSKVADVVHELQSFAVDVDVIDAYAGSNEVEQEYGYPLVEKPEGPYDGVVIAVAHKPYKELDEAYFKELCPEKGIVVDVKGIFRNKIREMEYISL